MDYMYLIFSSLHGCVSYMYLNCEIINITAKARSNPLLKFLFKPNGAHTYTVSGPYTIWTTYST